MTRHRRNATLLLLIIILVLTAACKPSSKAPTSTPRTSAKAPTATPRKASARPTSTPPEPVSAPEVSLPFRWVDANRVGQKKIGPEGGTLIVSSPDDPLDGMTVEVPAGAFEEGVDLEVIGLEIEDHSLGEHVNLVTSMIAVSGANGLAEELLTLTIPIDISPDEFAMAFAYDDASRKLQGLALLESTNNSVKVATRDLSRLVLVSKVLVGELYGGSDTAFQHGLDDWYFPNGGSYIAPGGHCAGQSISAMYYYIEELGPPLYGRYDNYDNWFEETPDLWQDDEAGYRLASMTQVELDWDGHGRKFWSAFNAKYNDHVVYNAFAYSMLVTGMPQFVGIYGKDKDGETVGHAIIAYKIDDNQIYVSDPNFPAWAEGGREERTITYDPAAGKFEPYPSGPTAGSSGVMYDRTLYFGYKDLIDWELMGELWKRLDDGWIGMDRFPFYELVVRQADSEEWEPLSNNHVSEDEEIVVWMRDYQFGPLVRVYGPDEKLLTYGGAPIPLKLKEGDNWFGFQISGGKMGGEKVLLTWIGFDWINIIYEEAEKPQVPTPTKPPVASGQTDFHLCELEGAKWRITVNEYDECISVSDAPPGYEVTTHVRRFKPGDEHPCWDIAGEPDTVVTRELDWEGTECAYIVSYLDPATGAEAYGKKARWALKFVVGDLVVIIDAGEGGRYPEHSSWVQSALTQFSLGYRRLARTDDWKSGKLR